MAVSPLAQIDWDNLAGEDSNVVMDLLQRAFNERMYVAAVASSGISGANNAKNFFPFPDGSPTNNFTWGEFGGLSKWSLTEHQGTNPSNNIMDLVVRAYADMTFINDNIDTIQSQSDLDDDLALDSGKVFGYVGITDWPEVFNPNVTDLKAWYDILLLLTHIRFGLSGFDTVKTETEGLYDGFTFEFGNFTDKPYGKFYDTSSTGLAADWAQLYTGPVSRAETREFGVVGPIGFSIGIGIIGILPFNFGLGDYQILALHVYRTYDNQELTDTGYTREPELAICYGRYEVSRNNGPVPGNTVNTDAYLSTNDIVNNELREFPTTYIRTPAEKEISVDVGPFTTPPAFSDQVNFAADIEYYFYEKWNDPTGTTGFEFYTP